MMDTDGWEGDVWYYAFNQQWKPSELACWGLLSFIT